MALIARRHPFSLIEVLISLVLISGLLSLLFLSYRQTAELKKGMAEVVEPLREESALLRRLDRLFSEVCAIDGETDRGHFFFTSTCENAPSLVLTYNNGIDRDQRFCGEVLGRLYLTSTGDLMLAKWPLPAKWKGDRECREELLLSGITSLEFGFFEPPHHRSPIVDGIKPKENLAGREREAIPKGWGSLWKREYGELPAIVELRIESGSNTISMKFSLHESRKPIRTWWIKGSKSNKEAA